MDRARPRIHRAQSPVLVLSPEIQRCVSNIVLREMVRGFPAVTRTFTKDTVRHNTVLCEWTHIQRYMESQQATCCCSKRFGFFRLSNELLRKGHSTILYVWQRYNCLRTVCRRHSFIHSVIPFILFQRSTKVDIELVIKINNIHITEWVVTIQYNTIIIIIIIIITIIL